MKTTNFKFHRILFIVGAIGVAILVGGLYYVSNVARRNHDPAAIVVASRKPGAAWVVESIIKSDPELPLTVGATLPKATGDLLQALVTAGKEPTGFVIFYEPKFFFFGALQLRGITAVYLEKNPATPESMAQFLNGVGK
ncbi:MAG: hypothetical protein ABI615_10990 [Chthoniobacterales bacterium]